MQNPPLIAHIVHRFGVGGLENGVVNLINGMPAERYRHVVIALTDYSDFRNRISKDDVQVHALHKKEGRHPVMHGPLWRILRELRPSVVHTRNLATLEAQIPACFLGVPARIHGEHGRDVFDLHGSNRRYNLLRKAIRPMVQRYITVSRDLQQWLSDTVGVPPRRITQIYNGVDSARFSPRAGSRSVVGPPGFMPADAIVIGTVGRMAAVKDQLTLVKAFLHLLAAEPDMKQRLRLVLVGDGPLRAEARALLREAEAEGLAWLPGDQNEIPELLRSMDIFALPSVAEGISNTILEAMSCGLPVVATRVGGSPELVGEGMTGTLVPPADEIAMAEALRAYIHDPGLRSSHGAAARRRVEEHFSLETMVEHYMAVYDQLLFGYQVSDIRHQKQRPDVESRN